jgi:hypothetical protein
MSIILDGFGKNSDGLVTEGYGRAFVPEATLSSDIFLVTSAHGQLEILRQLSARSSFSLETTSDLYVSKLLHGAPTIITATTGLLDVLVSKLLAADIPVNTASVAELKLIKNFSSMPVLITVTDGVLSFIPVAVFSSTINLQGLTIADLSVTKFLSSIVEPDISTFADLAVNRTLSSVIDANSIMYGMISVEKFLPSVLIDIRTATIGDFTTIEKVYKELLRLESTVNRELVLRSAVIEDYRFRN